VCDAPVQRQGDCKQQLTAARLQALLVDDGHAVKTAMAEWRRREIFIPLSYRPGDLAEVDFFEVPVDVAGRRRNARLLLLA
jgi:hypothetical protein